MNKLPEQFSPSPDWDQARAVIIQREAATAQLTNYMRDGFLHQVRTITSSTTMLKSDSIVLVDATTGAVTLTLLPAAQCKEKRLVTKKIDASVNAMTLTPNGSEKIDGAATYTSIVQYNTVEIASDGSNWYAV